jgi:predicted transcriptional regulator
MVRTKKSELLQQQLSRRERQIMGAVYRLRKATVAEVVENIPDPPTADAVRRLCHILEEKGYLKALAGSGPRTYAPTVNLRSARKSALDNLLDTFFGGSPHTLVATLLDARRDDLSQEDIDRLTDMIDEAEKKKDR